MPETQKLTIEARATRKGDKLYDGHWCTVTRVETKMKWTYVHVGMDDKVASIKVLPTDTVTVLREVLTHDEKVAQLEAFAAEECLRAAQKSYAKVEATATAIVECKWTSSLYPYMHDHAAAMVERDLWDEALRETGQDDGDGGKVTFVRAVRYVHDKQCEAMLDNRYRGSSTSDFSNAVEAAARETVARWIRGYAVQSCVKVAKGDVS